MTHDTITLNEPDAIAASKDAGYIIAELVDGQSPTQIGGGTDFEQCRVDADALAQEHRGRRFGIFKLARIFGPI